MAIGLIAGWPIARSLLHRSLARIRGSQSVEQRLAAHGPSVRPRWVSRFADAGHDYPPKALALLAMKEERELRVFAIGEHDAKHIVTLPILAASGERGPKLREGDRQVPEGFYRVESLHPNSAYHLALRLDYPSAEDVAQATVDGRHNVGGDIMIHGRAASIGCLAIGDAAIEELFVLAADVGIANIEVIIAPCDLCKVEAQDPRAWVQARYGRMRKRMHELESR